MKTARIIAIILSLGLVAMSIYTINTYNKDASKSATSKIVVDIFAALFIIGGVVAIVREGKALA